MKRVLVVEDDFLLALPIEVLLADARYSVELAHSGQEATQLLEREGNRLDALVTDIRLGSGPDGWEVARRARGINEALQVVYMTGDSATAWASEGVPGSTLLRKPFPLDDLLRELDRGIGGTQTGGR